MKTAADFPRLNLPPCRLKVAERDGELCVWDVWRGRWLVLTPEEWVRRHVLAMLAGRGFGAATVSQEHPVNVNGQPQRADIVLFGAGGRAVMVVECKAPEVVVDGRTLAQAFRYNAVLGAGHVMLTNGLDHYIYRVSPDGSYTPLSEFPDLK